MSGIPGLDVKHVIGGAVAASAVAVALAGGGFEPTAYAAAGLVVWIAVVIGLAVGVLPRSQPPTAALVAGISLAGLAALTALSLAWASDDGNGFEDVVRTLAYLGAFAAVVLASRRNEATPWLAGLAVGVAAIAAIALLARFEPSLFGNPDADLADLPAVLGRLIYPIGYWNGLAAVMAAAIVLLSWFAATAGSVRARAGAVAALPPVLLALWMTDSRGGIAAAVIAFGVLLVVGPRRSLLLANLVLRGCLRSDLDRGRRDLRHPAQRPYRTGGRRRGRPDAGDHARGGRVRVRSPNGARPLRAAAADLAPARDRRPRASRPSSRSSA